MYAERKTTGSHSQSLQYLQTVQSSRQTLGDIFVRKKDETLMTRHVLTHMCTCPSTVFRKLPLNINY